MHRGTIKNLEGKLAINGVTLTQPELSMLTRIGRGVFCNPVGTVKPSAGKGKSATIWEFKSAPRFTIEAVTVQATAAPEVSATSDATVETVAAENAANEATEQTTVELADATEL